MSFWGAPSVWGTLEWDCGSSAPSFCFLAMRWVVLSAIHAHHDVLFPNDPSHKTTASQTVASKTVVRKKLFFLLISYLQCFFTVSEHALTQPRMLMTDGSLSILGHRSV